MSRAPEPVIAITEDGTRTGRLLALVGAEDLTPAFGEQPLQLLREIGHAPDLGSLRSLNQRCRRLVLDRLVTPSSVDWLLQLTSRLDEALISRAARLSSVRTDAAGMEACWFLFGASGRGESLTPLRPQLGVVFAEEDDRVAAQAANATLLDALTECGYLASGGRRAGDSLFRCASHSEWKQRYAGWVHEPVVNEIYRSRGLFDVRPIAGAFHLLDDLRAQMRDDIGANPGFLKLLAHDCLGNLPPLAFFQDLVVDESGERSATFELEKSALRPVVDVARVFGMAAGSVLAGSSLQRLARAREVFPDHEAVFREAADALRVVLYYQGRSGLRHGHGGTEIAPKDLSRQDRQTLKSGFHAIGRLVEFTAGYDWSAAS